MPRAINYLAYPSCKAKAELFGSDLISAGDVKFGAAFVGLGGVQTVCAAGAVPGTFLPTYLRRRWLGTGAQSPGR